MKKLFKSITSFLLSAAVISSASAFTPVSAEMTGINVERHTKAEIIDYINAHPYNNNTEYDQQPNYQTAPYDPGRLSDGTLQSALNTLNIVRYIAGIGEVTLSDSYTDLAQTGVLVNAVNNQMSHTPTQPSDMSDELYQKGYEGTSSSNLGWGYRSLSQAVLNGWMSDADSYNIDVIGHRRWCLNPAMKQTGFGMVSVFTSMYSFDNAFGATEYYGVCWPAQTMPIELFNKNDPWSISMGSSVDASSVKVTVTSRQDGQKWEFSQSSADGFFNVNNDYYGKPGCIIFRPDNITYSSGDSFDVTVEGLSSPVSYTVDFVDLTPETDVDVTLDNLRQTANFLVNKTFDADMVIDINDDKKINVFDLAIMKRKLVN